MTRLSDFVGNRSLGQIYDEGWGPVVLDILAKDFAGRSHVSTDDVVLDVGCGTGAVTLPVLTLAIVAAFMGCGGSNSSNPTALSSSPTAPSPSTATDTITLTSITPLAGTTLSPGQVVTFTATVSYELDSADSGQIRMVIQDGADRDIQSNPQPHMTISRGSGMVTLSDEVTI